MNIMNNFLHMYVNNLAHYIRQGVCLIKIIDIYWDNYDSPTNIIQPLCTLLPIQLLITLVVWATMTGNHIMVTHADMTSAHDDSHTLEDDCQFRLFFLVAD